MSDPLTGTLENCHKTALSDLSSLGRVSHRLAMTDEVQLETVLALLLPRLLQRIGTNHQKQQDVNAKVPRSSGDPEIISQLKNLLEKIHSKLVEMLSHAMKRVRHDANCKLNCEAILDLLLEDQTKSMAVDSSVPPKKIVKVVDPFTLNLSLTFLTMGIPRCSNDRVESLLPGLMVLAGSHSGLLSITSPARKQQSHQISHILLRAIEIVATPPPAIVVKPTSAQPPPLPTGESVKRMDSARTVCRHDTLAGGAVYELLLNALLYQPSSPNMPPPGLSFAGHELLIYGVSLKAKDWATEMAPLTRLKNLKLALLDFVAPCRRWALFMNNDAPATSSNDNSNNASSPSWLGLSRTIALLVVASGDANLDVADRASSYLRVHRDSFRVHKENSDNDDVDESVMTTDDAILGNPISLSCSLLSLVLGQANAENALNSDNSIVKLGMDVSHSTTATAKDRTLVMSTKRRMVSEKTSFAIMTFCSAKILEENPQLMNTIGTSMARAIGSLSIVTANHFLVSVTSATVVRANSPIAASAKLLNSLTIRLAAFYDGLLNNNMNSKNKCQKPILDLLSRSLSIASSVLAGASSPNSTSKNNTRSSTSIGSGVGTVSQGLVATRDACYGVVCALSRSRFAQAWEGLIFSCGSSSISHNSSNHKPLSSSSSSTVVSIETAALLFGCASNETEVLRPRAVAALDALLGAYCRAHNSKHEELKERASTEEMGPDLNGSTLTVEPTNPWNNNTESPAVSSQRTAQATSDRVEFVVNMKELSRALLPLLWSAAQSSQPKASRVAASRWSTDLLKTLDLPNACHILCFLAGDTDVTAASIAREGLGLGKKIGNDDDINSGTTSPILPEFSDLCSVLFVAESNKALSSSSWRPRYQSFSYIGKASSVRFGLMCLLSDLYGGDDEAVEIYIKAVAETLVWLGEHGSGSTQGREAIDLLDECSICWARCLSTSRFARSMIVSGKSPFHFKDMVKLSISANSSKARRYLAESCGHVYEDYSLWCEETKIPEWSEKCQIASTMECCAQKLTEMQSNLFMVGEVHGAAFLGARSLRAFRLYAASDEANGNFDQTQLDSCWRFASSIISALSLGTAHSDEVIGNACAQGLFVALSYDGDDAPILDKRLYGGTSAALINLNSSLRKYGNGDHTDPTRATRLAEATGMLLAATTSAAGYKSDEVELGPARIQCVDALFSILGSTAFRKDPEIALVTGEALAIYADAFSPDGAIWTSAVAIEVRDSSDAFDETFANELPPHQQVLYFLLKRESISSSPHKRTACATALLALAGRAAKMVNRNATLANRAFASEILQQLGDIQVAFITLLAYPKSKQLARESCCLGLAACQGLADAARDSVSVSQDLNDRLLSAFGQTTNYGGSAMMETRAQADSRARENDAGGSAASLTESFGIDAEVGGVSGMTEAALGAYREMASASMALGRPDILYALMLLSVSHPLWCTTGPRDRYCAASLLGENSAVGNRNNAAEIRSALRPHLAKLIPRLLRACNDPNKQTREQMGTLWIGLTGGGAESRQAISQHLFTTMDTLTEDASNKLWRARVGACGALTEVIVGRSWDELGGGRAVLDDDDLFSPFKGLLISAGVRLLRMWRVAMRALDDVRISVRESGETLARGVRSLTIRLCDPSSTEKSVDGSILRLGLEERAKAEHDASAAASTALRWLVKNGLNQPCAEATGACVSTLLGIVEVVRPSILAPVLPELIDSLLMAMSGLEPAAFNYLQVRSAGQDPSGVTSDRLERVRLQMAQSGPIADALNKCLGMIPSMPLAVQKAVIPRLDSAIRCGAGFATRAAAADAVSTLSSICPLAFKFPGQSTTNPTVRLLRALYFASERERGVGARDKMAHALGNLAELSPRPSVRSLALRACERYNGATGSNDDPVARRASAAALRSLACRATSQFSDGGTNEVWCRRVLPIAFLGQKDSDSKVASLWKEVWEEGGSAANVSSPHDDRSINFGVLLHEKLLPYLVRACVDALNDVSWSRRVTACAALGDLADLNVLAPAPRSLTSCVTNPNLLRARRRAQASATAIKACIKLIVKSRVWAGKKEVVKCCVKVAGKWTAVGADESDVYGWDDITTICPWAPVVISPKQNINDLFSGDQWFKKCPETQDSESDAAADEEKLSANSARDEEDVTQDSNLNLKDCDALVGDETSPSGVEEDVDGSEDEEPEFLTFAGLSRALLEQGISTSSSVSCDETLPYRAAALQGLADLLTGIESDEVEYLQLQSLYRMIAPSLVSVIDTGHHYGRPKESSKAEPPLIVAKSINCLAAAMWIGIGKSYDRNDRSQFECTSDLTKMFSLTGGEKQPAWTVRESSILAAANLVAKCDPQTLQKYDTVSTLLACATYALKDRKFSRVRYAGLKLLLHLVGRVGTTMDNASIPGAGSLGSSSADLERQLVLEALLPHKEKIMKMARSSLSDSEAKVTSMASEVCSAIAWWP